MTNINTTKSNETKTTRRKTGVARLTFKSESVYLFMRKTPGDNLNNAMYRMGELFKMTSRSHDKELFNSLIEWFNNQVIIPADTEIEGLKTQLEILREEADSGIEFLDIKNPDMFIDVDVIHKSHGQIFTLLSKIDFVMDDIEALVLSGIDDDDNIEESSRLKMNLIINTIARKIFTVTKPGKRNGGAFSPVFFIQQLQQGVFSLYPEKMTNENTKQPEAIIISDTTEKQTDINSPILSANESELAEAV